jgi:type II secretory ATPase GspE/PulE/Tfp pilus assembly ATPase PilB-like protein
LCTCAKPRATTMEEMEKWGISPDKAGHLKAAHGCGKCNNTGYFGRVLLHETISIPQEERLREKVAHILSGGAAAISKIGFLEGIERMRRVDTARSLIEAGVVDFEMAERAVKSVDAVTE